MNKYVSRGLFAVLFAGGLSLIGVGAANAAETSGEDGLLSGTQVDLGAAVPVTVGGNAVSVLGDSSSSGSTAQTGSAPAEPDAAPVTSGVDSLLGGLQGLIGISVPVTVSGNAISVAGDTSTEDSSMEAATSGAAAPDAAMSGEAAGTSGADSVLGGTQLLPDVAIPVIVGGNAISLVGDSWSFGSGTAVAETPTGATDGAGGSTAGEDSVLGGTQLAPDVTVPVTLGGNAVSLLGDSWSSDSSATVSEASSGATNGGSTAGEDSVLGGTQLLGTVTVPVTLGGNAVSLLGDSWSDSTTTMVGEESMGMSNGGSTSGSDSALGGTQLAPNLGLPITVSGNAISAVGDSEAQNAATVAPMTPGGSDGATTGGSDSILGGTQLLPSLFLPVTIGGNAISVVGDSGTGGSVVTPGGPTDPTDPTNPVDPTNPTDPTTPVTPVTPTNPVTPGASTSAVGMVAGDLATTGVDVLPVVGLIAMLLLAGLALLGLRSRARALRH